MKKKSESFTILGSIREKIKQKLLITMIAFVSWYRKNKKNLLLQTENFEKLYRIAQPNLTHEYHVKMEYYGGLRFVGYITVYQIKILCPNIIHFMQYRRFG